MSSSETENNMLGVGKQKYTTNEPSYSWVVQEGKDENDEINRKRKRIS